MALTDSDSVKHTGAKAGSIVVGYRNKNRGTRMRLDSEQGVGEGGRVSGTIEVLDPGVGEYREVFAHFIGRRTDAESIILWAKGNGYPDFWHSVNANALKLEEVLTPTRVSPPRSRPVALLLLLGLGLLVALVVWLILGSR